MHTLRDYQQKAFEAAKKWLTKCLDTLLIEAYTAAGKSHIIAAVAEWFILAADKRVLVIQPKKELVKQNRDKYPGEASIYCAGLGQKFLASNVIFCTPRSIMPALDELAGQVGLVIIDEAHRDPNSALRIIAALRERNDKLRVLTLTATPYRMLTGYIYSIDERGHPVPEHQHNPEAPANYIKRLIYRVTAEDLLAGGWITPMALPEHIDGYKTAHLQANQMGKFNAAEQAVTVSDTRLTGQIVEQIVELCRDRQGVLIFATTVQHGHEIMRSLPAGEAGFIHGGLSDTERDDILIQFCNKKLKYLVNVEILTTGFDCTHIDVIVLMRLSESPGLIVQILGRGARIDTGKTNFLLLDYAENIERHFTAGDLFNPKVEVKGTDPRANYLTLVCPLCHSENVFRHREEFIDTPHNQEGYIVDLAGDPIKNDEGQKIPAHYGRRCTGAILAEGHSKRCEYRFIWKECLRDGCGHKNDIAARYCVKCGEEIVDPNKKLKETPVSGLDFGAPSKIGVMSSKNEVIEVFSIRGQPEITRAGNPMFVLTINDSMKNGLKIWINPVIKWSWKPFMDALGLPIKTPHYSALVRLNLTRIQRIEGKYNHRGYFAVKRFIPRETPPKENHG